MFGSEPFAGAREAGLHFVGNEKNAMLAADVLQKLEVIARRDDKAALPQNRLGDDRGDGFGSDGALEGVFEVMSEGFSGGACLAAIRVSERDAVDVAGERFKTGFVRMCFAGKRHGEKRAAVEGVLETDNRGTLGVGA